MEKILDSVNLFISSGIYDIIKIEEQFVKKSKFNDISYKDAHIIEIIKNSNMKKMSIIAQKLNVTLGTLTVSINALEKKGYVIRNKSLKDKRIVNVELTQKGTEFFISYKLFKQKTAKHIFLSFTNQEKRIFSGALTKLNEILNQQTHQYLN